MIGKGIEFRCLFYLRDKESVIFTIIQVAQNDY